MWMVEKRTSARRSLRYHVQDALGHEVASCLRPLVLLYGDGESVLVLTQNRVLLCVEVLDVAPWQLSS